MQNYDVIRSWAIFGLTLIHIVPVIFIVRDKMGNVLWFANLIKQTDLMRSSRMETDKICFMGLSVVLQ